MQLVGSDLELVGSDLVNCPPNDAEVINEITVYYLVRGYPFDKDDFKSKIEEKPQRFKGKPDNIRCQAHGLSVYTDINDVFATQEIFNHLKEYKVVVGMLTRKCGVIKKTPARGRKTHHTWWPFQNIDRSVYFKML